MILLFLFIATMPAMVEGAAFIRIVLLMWIRRCISDLEGAVRVASVLLKESTLSMLARLDTSHCDSAGLISPAVRHFDKSHWLTLLLLLSWCLHTTGCLPCICMAGPGSIVRIVSGCHDAYNGLQVPEGTATRFMLVSSMTCQWASASSGLWCNSDLDPMLCPLSRAGSSGRPSRATFAGALSVIHKLSAMSSIVCLIAPISVRLGPSFLAFSRMHAYVHVAQGPEICLPLSHCLAAKGSDMNMIPSS